jgi:hypothetical protein
LGFARALGLDVAGLERLLRAKVALHAARLIPFKVRTFIIKDYRDDIAIVVEDLTVTEVRPRRDAEEG